MNAKDESRWAEVKEHYGRAAQEEACCGPSYAKEELDEVPPAARLSYGSGKPVRHADLRPGEVVVDLGSGAGLDAFLAAAKVGAEGRVIGVDMTPEMLARSRRAAEDAGIENVEFREGNIEALPLEDASADVVISNCVINLSPDKAAVFQEANRVLAPGGRLVISDIVQERPLNLQEDCGCVSTAMLRGEYLDAIRDAGFEDVELLEDSPAVVTREGLGASAITLRAVKGARAS